MSDSLVLCRLFELLGGGQPSQLPQCAGAIFHLGDEYDMGTPQPVVDFTVQLMGDGEMPVGHRYSNRTMAIPVTIQVPGTGVSMQPTAADRLTLTAAREALLQAVAADSFELIWSPDGTDGTRETVFDCWKAKAAGISYNYKAEKQLTMSLTLNFDCYPWGRSDETSHIYFDSPILDSSQTPIYQLQDFETGTNGSAITSANTIPSSAFPFDTAFTSVALGASAAATFDNSPVAHDALSALINAGASNQTVKLSWTSPYTGATQWFREYVFFTANPGSTATLLTVLNSGAATVAKLRLLSTGKLVMDAGASAAVITTVNAIPLNQWVRIEGYVTGDAAVGQVSMSVYPSMDTTTALETLTSAATFNTAGVPVTFQFGLPDTGAGVSYQYNLDDVAISGNGPIGPYTIFGSGGGYYQPVDIDTFTTVLSTTQPTWWSTTTTTPYASNSARWSHNITDQASPLFYSRTLPSTIDIRSRTKMAFWLGMGVDAATYRLWHKGNTHFAIVLTDVSGHTLSFGFQAICTASNNPSWPFWNQVAVAIPQNSTSFRYDQLSKYSIKAWSETGLKANKQITHFKSTGYLAGVRATPVAGPKRPSSDRGGDYVLYGIDGTAPTPLNLHCQLGFQNYVTTTQTFDLPGTPGAALNYLAPNENPNWLSGDGFNFDVHGGIGSWTGSDGLATNATPTNSTTTFLSGTASMRVAPVTGGTDATVAGFTAAGISAFGVPCAPGDRITLRVNARAGTTARNITVGAEFFTSGGASISRVNLGAVADVNTGFTLISGRVTAPATAAFARPIITITTPAAGEFHYFDDIYISWGLQALVLCLAAGGTGGSVQPYSTAGGGGGGAEIAWETNLDLTPAANHAYTIGSGHTGVFTGASGPNGDNSSFAGSTVTVLAHGGTGGQNRLTADNSNGTGGTGGTGSTNSHHFNGGTGATGNHSATKGGGGGGAAGDGGAGSNAGTAPAAGQGGTAGSLAQGGGNGGTGATNNNSGGGGGYGQATGGGGAGAAGTTATHTGGRGADGKIKVILTTYTSQANFPTLLIHKPSPRSGIKSSAVIPVGGGQDIPDGREYGLPVVDTFNARYDGTYTVYAVNFTWSLTTARTVTATFKQYEISGGAVSSASVSQSITPANVLNGMVNLGEITLPIKDMADDNIDSVFTAAVTSGQSGDRFLDLILVDTSGQLVLINLPGGGYTDYWIDKPDINRKIGRVLGSTADRQQAVSVMANSFLSGGPLKLDPGVNVFTIYSPQGQPGLDGEYIAQWWQERLN